jgi:predicted Kef-type K+ transport protein
MGAFQATSLTFPIIVATFGIDLRFLSAPTAAALVAAGLLSVVLMPALALLTRPWEDGDSESADLVQRSRKI